MFCCLFVLFLFCFVGILFCCCCCCYCCCSFVVVVVVVVVVVDDDDDVFTPRTESWGKTNLNFNDGLIKV